MLSNLLGIILTVEVKWLFRGTILIQITWLLGIYAGLLSSRSSVADL